MKYLLDNVNLADFRVASLTVGMSGNLLLMLDGCIVVTILESGEIHVNTRFVPDGDNICFDAIKREQL